MRPIIAAVVLIFLIAMIVTVQTSLAQETTGALEGQVLDLQGLPLPGAEVGVTGAALQGVRVVTAGGDGRFLFPVLPIGFYTVRVSKADLAPFVLHDVRVRLGQTADVGEIRLGEQTFVVEDLVVTGRAPLIDPASTEVGGNLVDDEFADLPIDRDYQSIATLLPHVNGYSFAGATDLENKYFIDGVDNTNPLNGELGTSLPYNFVQELQVRVGGYQAEYRGALGGTVNAVTRMGANEFHGQVFGFFLNNNLTADPQLVAGEPPRGDFTMYDAGASFGGALRRDKLWYFAAYNPSVETEDVAVAGVGTLDRKTVAHRFAGKLNWRLNDANDLTLSVIGDPTSEDGLAGPWHALPTGYESLDPLLMEWEHGGYTAALSGKHWLSDDVLLESDLSGYWQGTKITPATEAGKEELYYYDAETGIVSGGAVYSPGEAKTYAGTAKLAMTFLMSDHTVKSGVEYRNKSFVDDTTAELLIRALDPDLGEYYEYLEVGSSGENLSNRTPSLFLQDSWRIGDRLRLNLGVRWDAEYLVGSDSRTAQSITDEWQPRVGFTYEPGSMGKHKVFGSAGRFYQELALAALTGYYTTGSYQRYFVFGSDPRLGAPADTLFQDIISTTIQEEDEGMKGQYFDEITLGYERRLGERSKITVRGIYRALGQGLEDGFSIENDGWFWGNPGRGKLSDLPAMERDYRALELTFLHAGTEDYHLLASYVYSRTYGNYPGIGGGSANFNPQWDAPDQVRNGDPYDAESVGHLPNDRPHVFKLSGAYDLLRGREHGSLKLGSSLVWMSGTPLNEFGVSRYYGWCSVFLQPRGTVGRTPAIWDLGLRISYEPPPSFLGGLDPRLILDLLHIGSPRKALSYEQQAYSGVDQDGNPTNPNPSFGQATSFQPPMALRIGVEAYF